MPTTEPGSKNEPTRVDPRSLEVEVPSKDNNHAYRRSERDELENLNNCAITAANASAIDPISSPEETPVRKKPRRNKKRTQSPPSAGGRRVDALQLSELVLRYDGAHVSIVNSLSLVTDAKPDKGRVHSVEQLNRPSLLVLRALWMASGFVTRGDLLAVRRLNAARVQMGKAITRQSLGAMLFKWQKKQLGRSGCAGRRPTMAACVRQASRIIDAALDLGFAEPDPDGKATRAFKPVRATKKLDQLMLKVSRRTLASKRRKQ